uniref:Triacylglycerol lipase n=1 Tax=Bursaphelenchus xylophilus TaxID=6326 RepID=A0A1I7S2G0_BURXY
MQNGLEFIAKFAYPYLAKLVNNVVKKSTTLLSVSLGLNNAIIPFPNRYGNSEQWVAALNGKIRPANHHSLRTIQTATITSMCKVRKCDHNFVEDVLRSGENSSNLVIVVKECVRKKASKTWIKTTTTSRTDRSPNPMLPPRLRDSHYLKKL